MLCKLLIDRVNQLQGPNCESAGVGFGFHPDGKKLRPEIAGARFAKVQMTLRNRSIRREIEALVEKALRRVGVPIDHQGRFMDPYRLAVGRVDRSAESDNAERNLHGKHSGHLDMSCERRQIVDTQVLFELAHLREHPFKT